LSQSCRCIYERRCVVCIRPRSDLENLAELAGLHPNELRDRLYAAIEAERRNVNIRPKELS
jgi:hypothetical protein